MTRTGPAVRVDHLAVADLVLHPAEGVDAEGVAADAQFRLLGHLDLGDQAARRRIPAGELDAGGLADHAASSVAPDEILRPQRLAVGQLDVDAGVVLRETRHLTPAIDRHRQLVDPVGQDALDVVLPQPEPVRVPGGKVADVQPDPGERRDLHHLPLREEPIGDATLIEHLDRARVQTARARAGELLAGAPLDDRDVDPRQRQLARQHQPGRASSGDHHRMLGHIVASPRFVALRKSLGSRQVIMARSRQSPADQNLHKIDHIVVLMMENRSFDHMLGFLTIDQGRDDIEGPTPAMSRTSYRGETYHVHPATRTTLTKAQDPCHGGWCVDEQLANDNGGFVSNYMKTRKGGRSATPDVVMAYHTADQLPVYAYLARPVLRLRPLVLLGAGRDDAEPLLRRRRQLGRPARQPQAEPAVQPPVVRAATSTGRRSRGAGTRTTTCRCSG